MSRLQKFKAFINKSDVDYSEGLINPYEFHKTFYVFMRLCRVLDEVPPKWTIFIPIFVIVCGTLATAICLLGCCHSVYIFDVPLITENGTYLVVMVYKLLIISTTITDVDCYHKLMQAIREDFEYICTVGSKYRERFFDNHAQTFKASILTAIFTASIAAGMASCAIIALIIHLLTNAGDQGKRKPLPFPFWMFGVDFDSSPAYQISFSFFVTCIVSQTITYIFMMQAQIVWIRQITSKADVIIWSIHDLLVDIKPSRRVDEQEYNARLIKHRMASIVKMHQSMFRLLDAYTGVFKKCLMFEQTFAGPLVCLTAYCVVEQLDHGTVNGILMLLGCATIVLIFIPNYLCTFLHEKIQSVGNACYEIPFWEGGRVLRPYLLLIMQRSRRPLPVRAPGFKEVSLQTYATIMANAYKCFNMLRQANFEI